MKVVICHMLVFLLVTQLVLTEVKISRIKLWGDHPSVELTMVPGDQLSSPIVVVYQNSTVHNKYSPTFHNSTESVFTNISIVPDLRKIGAVAVYNGTEPNITDAVPLLKVAVVYVFNNSLTLIPNMAQLLNTTVLKVNAIPSKDQFLYLCNDVFMLTNTTDCSNGTSPVISTSILPTGMPSTVNSSSTATSGTTASSATTKLPVATTAHPTLQTTSVLKHTTGHSSVTSPVSGSSTTTLPSSGNSSITPLNNGSSTTNSTTPPVNGSSPTTLPSSGSPTASPPVNGSSPTTLPSSGSPTATSPVTGSSTTTLPSSVTPPVNGSSTTTLPSSGSPSITPLNNGSSTVTLPHNGSSTTTQPKPTSPRPSVTSVKPSPQPLINEVNLLLAEKKFFIELKGLSGDVQNLSVVVFDGEVGTCLTHIKMNNTISSDANGFGVFPVDDAVVKTKNAYVVALFDTTNWDKSPVGCTIALNVSGLKDVLIISKHMDILSSQVLGAFARDKPRHLMIVDPETISGTGQNYSISRCAPWVMDSSAFILSHPTRHGENECKTDFGKKIQLKLTDARCKDFKDSGAKQQFLDMLVYKMADFCSCGISPLLFKLQKYHCGSLIFEAFLEAVNSTLANKMFISYNNFIQSTQSLTIGNKTYKVDTTCNNDCLTAAGGKQGNIKQTIAVVMSCLAVFLIIVVVVVIYLKKKRRGVLQFRMTRLDEDDDDLMNPEMDDFVGSGQDASFENRLYSHFNRK
ncbi:uncharacterized protein LOC121372296 [Gigantopelta aegis]|uniref:uncharacterized protein LOC121372296 n=1 Tax=Gigantopelta aegis TaxID=1735272 RepID=UPI001B88E5E3|nr:uncharacterized protein LOC121372296 [Gigantopelta aegis]